MVDLEDLKSFALGRAGSSPAAATKLKEYDDRRNESMELRT